MVPHHSLKHTTAYKNRNQFIWQASVAETKVRKSVSVCVSFVYSDWLEINLCAPFVKIRSIQLVSLSFHSSTHMKKMVSATELYADPDHPVLMFK